MYRSGNFCPPGASNGGAQLAPSVEQTTWRRVSPIFLLLLRFIFFQLHHLTPQAALPHLCNWNLLLHQSWICHVRLADKPWLKVYQPSRKYGWLICCERKILFVGWKSTAYKPNEQDVCGKVRADARQGKWYADWSEMIVNLDPYLQVLCLV